MSNNVLNAILKAIDIISTLKIKLAKYDKTIQGVILLCIDATIGKYKIQYQDSIFIAYSENTSASYSKGTSVYILVPNSDMTKTKTIIGAVNKLGTNFILTYEIEEKYNLIGSNVVTTSTNEWGLCSYKLTLLITLYDYENPSSGSLSINTSQTLEYLHKSDLIILSMKVKTSLDENQKFLGNYGLVVLADFIDQTAQLNLVTRYFILDIDNFVGNPYLYSLPTRQKIALLIDGKNFIRIRSINLFSKNFPNNTLEEKPDDIFISDLQIQGGIAFTTDELNSQTLALITPRGYIFDESDAATATRTIEASVRIKGKKADVISQNISFYWFVEDPSVITSSAAYVKDAGQGWRCLNKSNSITGSINDFIPGDSIYILKKQDIAVLRVKFKCIAVYLGDKTIVLSKLIEIINYDAAYRIEIDSDLGTRFYKDNGKPTLTCRVYRQGLTLEIDSSLISQYVWSMTSSIGVFESLSVRSAEASTFYSITKTLEIDVSKIVNFAIFKCSAYVLVNGVSTFIGTAAITISNSLVDDNSYYLIINNGTQLFKYTTTGVSPASKQLDDPILIKALSFSLYNNVGDLIDTKLIEQAKIIWNVPIRNTLLKIVTSHITPDDKTITNVDILDISLIVYQIKDNYSSYDTNNQIKLTIKYNGELIKATTDFNFIKLGLSGTNGTDFTFRIVPNVQESTHVPQYPTLTYYGNLSPYYNWTRAEDGDIKAELWHNGDLIYTSSHTSGTSEESMSFNITSCQILYNYYGKQNTTTIQDRRLLNITGSSYFSIETQNRSSYLNANSFYTTPLASLIKGVASYEGTTFTSIMPVCIGYLISGTATSSDRIYLKEGTGFNRVLYTSSGVKPMYDSRNPFEIEIVHNGTPLSDSQLNSYTFEWNSVGSVWSKQQSTWTLEPGNYLTVKTNNLKRNQVSIKPSNSITGECVTTAVICRVKKSGSLFGFLYIPIHMYLNQYLNSAINGWDGNSIDLGLTNGGMILAPQVGAGSKDLSTNTFTGMVMGVAKDPQETSSTGYDVGLFGYYQGKRSIFLDSKTGKAYFGVTGTGQIIIDPSNQTAILKSGNYSPPVGTTTPGTGMQINLSEPEIRYGNGKFIVDNTGKLTANGADITGALRITTSDTTFIATPNGGWDHNGIWLGGNSFANGKFKVSDLDGSVTIRNGDIILGTDASPSVTINKTDGILMRKGSIKINPVQNVDNKYNVELDTSGIRIKYDTSDSAYNFEATSSGNVYINKNLNVGRLSANRYAFTVNDQGKINLYSAGSSTNIKIDANGVLTFGDSSSHTATIKFDTVEVVIPSGDATYDSSGAIIAEPSLTTSTVSHLKLTATLLSFTGDVSVSKNLSAKNFITSNGIVKTKGIEGQVVKISSSSGSKPMSLEITNNKINIGLLGSSKSLYIYPHAYIYSDFTCRRSAWETTDLPGPYTKQGLPVVTNNLVQLDMSINRLDMGDYYEYTYNPILKFYNYPYREEGSSGPYQSTSLRLLTGDDGIPTKSIEVVTSVNGNFVETKTLKFKRGLLTEVVI